MELDQETKEFLAKVVQEAPRRRMSLKEFVKDFKWIIGALAGIMPVLIAAWTWGIQELNQTFDDPLLREAVDRNTAALAAESTFVREAHESHEEGRKTNAALNRFIIDQAFVNCQQQRRQWSRDSTNIGPYPTDCEAEQVARLDSLYGS